MEQIISVFWIVLRPLARLYFRLARPLTMGVRGLVRDEEGRVLLVRHSYTPGWYLPGGGVERSETVLTSLKRELDEEVGVLVTAPPRFIALYANFREFKSDHVALFLVEHGTYDRAPRKSLEIAEAKFFALDALPDDTTRGTRARLREIAEGLPAPDLW
jgi:8-oxo-dGTP pyrophosphatase MutT (NUDIX family)